MILLCKLLIFDNQTEVFPKRRHKSNVNKFHNYAEACGHALITRALAQALLCPKESMRPLKQLTRSSRSLEDLSCRTLANLSWLVSNSYFNREMHVRGPSPRLILQLKWPCTGELNRIRPLSSSPLPYAVFAPTLFEFDPIKLSSPLDWVISRWVDLWRRH